MEKKPQKKANKKSSERKEPARKPPSKIAESRAYVKQLEYEIERLESMQPDALNAVRFHRFVCSVTKHILRVLCVRGQLDSIHVLHELRLFLFIFNKLLARALFICVVHCDSLLPRLVDGDNNKWCKARHVQTTHHTKYYV